MRRPPVTSFSSAQRPVESRASSQPSTRRRPLRLCGLHQGLDDFVEVGRAVGAGALRPDQRDGFGEVADIVVGQVEQDGVDAVGDELADGGGFDGGDVEVARDRRDGPAARRIGGVAQIVADQLELRVARRREHQPFKKRGEGLHGRGYRAVARRSELPRVQTQKRPWRWGRPRALGCLPLVQGMRFSVARSMRPASRGSPGLKREAAGTGKGGGSFTDWPRTRFCAWHFLTQSVAGGATSMASSPVTKPMRPPEATIQLETFPQWRTWSNVPSRLRTEFTQVGSSMRSATWLESRVTKARARSEPMFVRVGTAISRVLVGHHVAFASAEGRVVEVEGVGAERVGELGGGLVAALRLHLEDAAAGAILGLDLHLEARAGALEDEIAFVVRHGDAAGEREAAVIRRLRLEGRDALAVGDVLGVRRAGEGVVFEAERARDHGELDVRAEHLEAGADVRGRDRDVRLLGVMFTPLSRPEITKAPPWQASSLACAIGAAMAAAAARAAKVAVSRRPAVKPARGLVFIVWVLHVQRDLSFTRVS